MSQGFQKQLFNILLQKAGECIDWLIWFLCLMAYQLFLGYLMPKPFSKNNSGTI